MIKNLILILIIHQCVKFNIDFADAQVTPGPISISYTFSNYSVAYGQNINILNNTIGGHTRRVLKVLALGTNQNLLASSSNDTTVKIWNATSQETSGKLLHNLPGHLLNVWALAYLNTNPSGYGLLASGSVDRTINIWDVNTGQLKRTLPFSANCQSTKSQSRRVCSWNNTAGHTNDVNTLSAMTGSLLASGSFDQTVRVWDAFTGDLIRTFRGHTKTIKKVLYINANGYIASVGFDGIVNIWDPSNTVSNNAKWTLSQDSSPINQVIELNNGRIATGANNSQVNVWDTNSGVLIHSFTEHTDIVHDLIFTSNEYLISASKDKTVRVWNVNNYTLVKTFTSYVSGADVGHRASVYRLIALTNGLFASCSFDKTIKLWDTKTMSNFLTYSNATVYGKTSHLSSILSATYLRERIFATGGNDSSVRVWRYDFNYNIYTFKQHSRFVTDVKALENGYVASCSVDYLIKIWNGNNNQGSLVWTSPFRGKGHNKTVNAVAYIIDGVIASASDDYSVKVWNWTAGSLGQSNFLIWAFYHTDKVNTLLTLSNVGGYSQVLASGSNDNSIQINIIDFDNNYFDQMAVLTDHTDSVSRLSQLLNGNLVSTSFDFTAKVWDLTSFQCMHTLVGHTDSIYSLQVLDDDLIATGAFDNTALVFNGLNGNMIYNLSQFGSSVSALAKIKPSGYLAAGSQDEYIRIYDMANGNMLKRLERHSSGIECLEALGDGYMISGSGDALIVVWNLNSTNPNDWTYIGVYDQSIGGHTSTVNALAFLSNQVTFASGSNDNSVKIWLNYQYY